MTTLKQYSNNTQRRLISVEKNAGADLLVFVERKFRDNECFDFNKYFDKYSVNKVKVIHVLSHFGTIHLF